MIRIKKEKSEPRRKATKVLRHCAKNETSQEERPKNDWKVFGVTFMLNCGNSLAPWRKDTEYMIRFVPMHNGKPVLNIVPYLGKEFDDFMEKAIRLYLRMHLKDLQDEEQDTEVETTDEKEVFP